LLGREARLAAHAAVGAVGGRGPRDRAARRSLRVVLNGFLHNN
jgi:hypothetical protein